MVPTGFQGQITSEILPSLIFFSESIDSGCKLPIKTKQNIIRTFEFNVFSVEIDNYSLAWFIKSCLELSLYSQDGQMKNCNSKSD